jgi:hypothetical protein
VLKAGGVIDLSVQSIDPGRFKVVATVPRGYGKPGRAAKSKSEAYGQASAFSVGGRPTALTVKPHAAARRALAQGLKLRVRVAVTFKSGRGGSPTTTVIRATVRGHRRSAKRGG